MYIPTHFQIDDDQTCFNIMKDNSFATLFSQHEGIPFATHLPLMVSDDHKELIGHFARPNPQWEDIQGQTVLATFHGPHCYISPSWYETDRSVPTWNYVTVHVYGSIELIHDHEEVLESMNKLVSKYEAPSSPYQLENIDPKYLTGMSKGVQGFRMKITKMEGKAKLSQNHSENRQQLVVEQLEKQKQTDEQKIAALMKANYSK
ncbi:FMN-binding negative transcriptional regulator [Pseudalkalibacillus berkeleyi]|uniref:FMN-binding negative transcriptional regulator n=1 Tax=Pseudalkalibacillus berkeleyi TaxID=1069813 RepID=A0ABS9H324_9BACL|nr:FMN-binding negative transcriptional regulator [Pseudalkalibacillus berkeleyi]MCF6138247.1 FMN-binding negative transcriptional regulator [Pseudalkalibacillus berkeleyi]